MRATRFAGSTATRLCLVALALAVAASAAGGGRAWATFNFTFTATNQIRVGPTGFDYVKVHCVVANTGTSADTYDILRTFQGLPAGWASSICVGGEDGTCVAPFVDSLYAGPPPCPPLPCAGPSGFGVLPGLQDTVSAYITPSGPEGSGYVTFLVRSVGDPTVMRSLTLGCVTTGLDVLVMDDDGGASLETYYEAAIPGGLEVGTWRRAVDGASSAELSSFPVVVWLTGSAVPTLDASDRTALAGYLGGGGDLVLSGQDVAYDLCDPGSPNYSAANVTWYETNLKSRYVNNNAASFNLAGIAGDPVSNAINLQIQGGGGANNQTDPDVIRPLTGAGECWTYVAAGNPAGATRVLGLGYRAVNLAFGFEAISSAADRATVMSRMLSWLAASPIAVGDVGVEEVPEGFALEPARPNPFNPATGIAFELERAGVARLRILDAAGRVVQVLADGSLAAGRHARVWDGRDAAGREMASGVYVAELTVDGKGSERVKLSLVR